MKYKSEIFEVIHESATEKFKIGAISEERMREYDKMCLASEADTDKTSAAHKSKSERPDFVPA
jgi:DNA-binding transcriptional regulator YiaG